MSDPLDHLRRQAAIFPEAAEELRIRLRIGEPPTGDPYPHSSECRTPDAQPAWELDARGESWQRGPCGGASSCTLVQHWRPPAPPPPPRPGDDDPELTAFEREHGRAHIEVKLDVGPGDRWAHWRATCSSCHASHRWHRQAVEHYTAHGHTIGDPDRRPARFDLSDLPARPRPSDG